MQKQRNRNCSLGAAMSSSEMHSKLLLSKFYFSFARLFPLSEESFVHCEVQIQSFARGFLMGDCELVQLPLGSCGAASHP